MTQNQPLVSVIMNCLNGEAYLREAIESVFAQTYQNWEIVFYDNASIDASAAIAHSYGNKLKYVRGKSTISLGAARNTAIAHASGDWVAFLDTDDKWLPQKLEEQISLLVAHPESKLCYSNVYVLKASSGKMCLAYEQQQPSGNVFASFLRYYPMNLQTIVVQRHALLELPELFDETLEVSEEYDVFMRFLYGAEAIYLDRPTAIYRVHTNMTSVRKSDRYPVENEYILSKLRKMVPKLDQLYPSELRYLQAKIGYWYAVADMAKGKKLQARAHLKPHKLIALEFMVLFLTTYFPIKVWRILLSSKTLLGAR